MILAALLFAWQSAGLPGVNVNGLAFNGNFYAATDTGVFRRAPGGDWASWNSGLDSLAVNAIAIDARTNVLYAGTAGSGVFKSVDAGQHWSAINNGLPSPFLDVSSIVVDNASAVYIGTRGYGIFKSTNGGTSWTEKPTAISSFIITLTIDPTNPAIVYAGSNRGVLKTSDGGTTWRAINNGITVPSSITAIVLDSSTIFASTPFGGVFRSDDAGENWIQINNGLTSSWVSALLVANRTVYAGTPEMGIFRSADKGATWTQFSEGLPNAFIHTLIIVGGQIFAGTSSGVFSFDFAPRGRSVRSR
jgi:photosystem II stability/assembly factor-like uncharacterized protein